MNTFVYCKKNFVSIGNSIFYSTAFWVIRLRSCSLSLNYFAFLCKLQVTDRYTNSTCLMEIWLTSTPSGKTSFGSFLQIRLDPVTLPKLSVLIKWSILPVFFHIWLSPSILSYLIFSLLPDSITHQELKPVCLDLFWDSGLPCSWPFPPGPE